MAGCRSGRESRDPYTSSTVASYTDKGELKVDPPQVGVVASL
ncbi:MAG TPA: hypothetical protein VMV23_09495 [Candidatus Nanopelagicaceae bacterium]|nr:hypothetical protein [Candidatus Nanopelagicaceae bacterium]